MTQLKRALTFSLAATLACAATAHAQPAFGPPALRVAPDHADGIYRSGDTVHWKVEWLAEGAPPADATYAVKTGGLKDAGNGALKFDGQTATFDTTFSEPNTVLVTVSAGPGKRAQAGAVADPFKIQPAAEEPADFDAFWKSKLEQLKRVPPNAKLTPEEGGKPGVTYAKVTLDNINDTHVQGQIARPEAGGKFPAILIPQWAGVYALQKSWCTDRAKDGWLALNIEAHDIPIDNPPDYYAKLYAEGGALHYYWKITNEDRETAYYLRMYLSCVQAVEYLKSRPDWDGKTIVVMGGSQGGQQSLVTAALCPESITGVLAFVPAACDNWAPGIGRAAGFPTWWTQVDNRDADKVRATSKYFDPVYFARRIKCPVLTACGLKDDLAPPSSVLAMANQLSCPKEIIILPKAGHQDENGSQSAYNNRAYGAWLPALAKGETPPVAK